MTIEGLSIEETKEMRKRGLAVPALTRLAKNDYYGSLVPMVHDAFLMEELIRIDCKGLEKNNISWNIEEVALRNIRRDAIKSYDKLEKEKKLSEDIVKDLSSDLQKVTDEYIKKVNSIFKQKEKELVTV